jgi:hypothetical protein
VSAFAGIMGARRLTGDVVVAFHRHDGPYAAATASRNKGPRAPMAAFDPSALAPPASGSRPPRNGSSALSARAQATLAAMDIEAAKAGESPYGAGALPRRALGRRASDSSITMGFPSTAANGKGQQLIEIYGVRCVLTPSRPLVRD